VILAGSFAKLKDSNSGFYSFTGFIHRMRGYHSVNDQAAGYENGVLPTSYYYVPTENVKAMHKYARLHGAFFNREFPVSWRGIDKSIGMV